jgi:Zn-dependent protease
VLIPSIILHEVSHGAVALIFGDDTAKRAGRLTLNPIRHVDPFGTVVLPAMMVLATNGGSAFGYAKPVPVMPGRMRNPRVHSLLTSLAGPGTNYALALLATFALKTLRPDGTVLELLLYFGLANVVLGTFNLIPLPPLDGSSMVEALLPDRFLPGWYQLRRHSMLILLALFLLRPGALNGFIEPVVDLWFSLLT